MKKLQIVSLMIIMSFITFNGTAQVSTNDFYDDAETHALKGTTKIQIAGEIENPGIIQITDLPLRSLIVKEALLSGDTNRFIGAYRYDGYSLYDILNSIVLKKKNEAEFPPIIDLYVKVENKEGDSVIFSWGELYYPVHRHEIIIATQVARIVPSKTKDLWPLPKEVKLVAGHDLVTERNIANPVKITVLSANIKYEVNKDLTPLFSDHVKILKGEESIAKFNKSPDSLQHVKYESVFYGRGRGIHSTTPFNGILVKELLGSFFKIKPEYLKSGYFIIASVDGYRCVFTFSEIFNRNDQAEVIILEDKENQDGGIFRLFPAADFFSDRAVKAVSEIRLIF